MRLLLLLICISTSISLTAQTLIAVKGLGEVSYVENEEMYTVSIEDFGTYDFKGSIKPLDLQTTITREQLSSFPNYELIEALELEDIQLQLTAESFTFLAKASTEKKLKNLCDAFNISTPYIQFAGLVTTSKVELKGDLDFSEDPIVVNFDEELATRLTLKNMGIGATSAIGKGTELSLVIFTKITIKPTTHDPDLNTSLQLKYDLTTLEVSGRGTMTDLWTNPLGISHYTGLKEDAIAFSDAAVSIGWIPSSSVPTSIGFAVEKANFFEMEFSTAISIAPLQKEIALKAERSAMTINEFTQSLEEGFGLKIPKNTFSDDMMLQDVEFLFSPNGGSIGEFEIEKGLVYKGGVQYSDKVSGNIAFYANGKENLSLDMRMDTEELNDLLKSKITKGKDTELEKVIEQALDHLQIKKIQLHLEANQKMQMTGSTTCELVLFEKEVNFSFDSAFTPEKVTSNLIKKIGVTALEHFSKSKKE